MDRPDLDGLILSMGRDYYVHETMIGREKFIFKTNGKFVSPEELELIKKRLNLFLDSIENTFQLHHNVDSEELFPSKLHSDFQNEIVQNSDGVYSSVYLIFNNRTGLYKIGTTMDLLTRCKRICQKNPGSRLVCSMYGYFDLEKTLHRKYAQWRVEGEWFRFPDSIIDEVLLTFKDPSL